MDKLGNIFNVDIFNEELNNILAHEAIEQLELLKKENSCSYSNEQLFNSLLDLGSQINGLLNNISMHTEKLDRHRELTERKIAIEKERIDRENQLIELKLKRLEQEYMALEEERKSIEEERKKLSQSTKGVGTSSLDDTGRLLFFGAIDEESIKKRYRELIKIFHPDNTSGNNMAAIIINYEYEKLKKIYGSFS